MKIIQYCYLYSESIIFVMSSCVYTFFRLLCLMFTKICINQIAAVAITYLECSLFQDFVEISWKVVHWAMVVVLLNGLIFI